MAMSAEMSQLLKVHRWMVEKYGIVHSVTVAFRLEVLNPFVDAHRAFSETPAEDENAAMDALLNEFKSDMQ